MKKKLAPNYLEKCPKHSDEISWNMEADGMITLSIENKGVFKRITQILLNKPKISYVHLDKTGSAVWPLIDGKKTIIEIGEELKKTMGDEINPLYERLAKFFQILESYGFITWVEK